MTDDDGLRDDEWEILIADHNLGEYTERLEVPGGWLYRIEKHGLATVVFVPYPSATPLGGPPQP
jgi:hypothetical protein